MDDSYEIKQRIQCDYLFVYGTLMSGMNNSFAKKLTQSASCLGQAFAHGLLFDYRQEYPCAVASIIRSDKIQGEIYQMTEAGTLLSDLDIYEDCRCKEPDRSLFIRCVVPVVSARNKKEIQAWMYFWNDSLDSLKEIPHGNYRKHCS
ncbi:gamma-glutamylcyclotransferase [Verrucomicrobia bacterium]|nr:gamma-glutamylcyclotransferase [Verrucomicrobiota bacterium]MDA7533209.1 gamma-glutamylcyclotransferase [Verrucomicrobiota bacterium]MDB4777754.1 gamma-glutamylcyclotransferase [Verrucomicrobiota bacterium]